MFAIKICTAIDKEKARSSYVHAKLQAEHRFRDKQITLNLRENDIDGWKSEMSLSLDNIPLDNAGFGTQNMVKAEMFMQQNIDVDILIIEEPENNLSYTNMSILISRLCNQY